MLAPTQADGLLEKWRKRSEIIVAFLNEYSEHASWEEWCDFFSQASGEWF